ncbi:AhpA/YtjB family protein [Psychromonas aquimarina]|uniref:AhpA/YtjB family protein n=1 Tax=Psychromonas aquimarina TaxID=444919 RepID=UPI0004901CC8|nr:AhpA/YtjB family protein [Psychromonas aquimarina]
MNKKMYYILRTCQINGLIIVCTVILYQITMLQSTSNQMRYQQTEKFSYSLTNLAAAEATRYLSQNKIKDLQLLIDDLSNDPIVRDATVYDNLGQILYQSTDSLPLQVLLKITDSDSDEAKGVIPYIAELYKEEEKIGYIRITLEQEKILSLIHNYQEKGFSTMWLLLTLSFIAGTIIMALFFRRAEAAYYRLATLIPRLIKSNKL